MIGIIVLLFPFSLLAETVKSGPEASTSSHPSTAAIQLNGCQPAQRDFEKPVREAAEKANLSNAEILARLIYSEALSTGFWKDRCQAPSADMVMKGIGWATMNRVHKARSRASPYYDTVFGKAQFHTSFADSSRKRNPFARAFLCPLEGDKYLGGKGSAEKIYRQAQKIAGDIIAEYEKSGIPPAYQRITNFFYPQSEYFGDLRPSWAKNKDAAQNPGFYDLFKMANQIKEPCVEFCRK